MHTPHSWRGLRAWKRHGLVLLVAGLVYIFVGVAYIFADQSTSRDKALHYALKWLPIGGWGIVFVLVGVLAIVSSRWPPVSETWGYAVMTGLSSGWAAFYAVGILFGHSPLRNITGVLVWGLLGFMWWAVSGLVNPPSVEEAEAWSKVKLPPSQA